MAEWTLSVSQLNEYVRRQMAGDPMLRSVRVEGEISGFKHHVSGHKYFILKDDKARVQCVMFRQNALSLDFSPKEGMKVVVTGSASVFVRDGAYQLYVEAMQEAGAGDLYREFERRKKKLAGEGIFDPALKRPLPAYPRAIGVATALGGAAFWDIVRVCQARNPHVSIVLSPCAVQGDGAAEDIARAIARLNARGGVDVLLVGRGGGSMEDLWAFNEEVVVRAIRASAIPVVSCVGHEIDFTLADFAADARAATPSNAAELAVPVRAELELNLAALAGRLASGLKAQLALARARLLALGASAALTMPGKLLTGERRNRLALLNQRMNAAVGVSARSASATLALLYQRMNAAVEQRLRAAQRSLALARRSLDALNPRSVLSRGFAVVEKADGSLVTGTESLHAGETVAIVLRDGRATARVEAVENQKAETQAGNGL